MSVSATWHQIIAQLTTRSSATVSANSYQTHVQVMMLRKSLKVQTISWLILTKQIGDVQLRHHSDVLKLATQIVKHYPTPLTSLCTSRLAPRLWRLYGTLSMTICGMIALVQLHPIHVVMAPVSHLRVPAPPAATFVNRKTNVSLQRQTVNNWSKVKVKL